MANPFQNRALSISGPATDISPVVPDDVADLSEMAIAIYVEGGGAISFTTASGQSRSVQVTDYSLLPVGVKRVNATGTTATGIHALVLA